MQKVRYFITHWLGLLNDYHHEAKAQNEVRVELHYEEVQICIGCVHLDVETQHHQSCQGVDQQRQQLEGESFLIAICFEAWVGGQDRYYQTEEKDEVLPLVGRRVPETAAYGIGAVSEDECHSRFIKYILITGIY